MFANAVCQCLYESLKTADGSLTKMSVIAEGCGVKETLNKSNISSFRRSRHAFDSRFAGVAEAGIQKCNRISYLQRRWTPASTPREAEIQGVQSSPGGRLNQRFLNAQQTKRQRICESSLVVGWCRQYAVAYSDPKQIFLAV